MSDEKTGGTTQEAADAMKRQGQTGTPHKTGSMQLNQTMKDMDAHTKPTPSPTPKPNKK